MHGFALDHAVSAGSGVELNTTCLPWSILVDFLGGTYEHHALLMLMLMQLHRQPTVMANLAAYELRKGRMKKSDSEGGVLLSYLRYYTILVIVIGNTHGCTATGMKAVDAVMSYDMLLFDCELLCKDSNRFCGPPRVLSVICQYIAVFQP